MRIMTRSSAGIALMSTMTNRQVEKLIRQIHYYELSGQGSLNLQDTMREVEWVRRTGYCLLKESIPSASGIAFPLRDDCHGIHMAIGVGGTTERICRKQVDIIEIVQNAIADFNNENRATDVAVAPGLATPQRKERNPSEAAYQSLY